MQVGFADCGDSAGSGHSRASCALRASDHNLSNASRCAGSSFSIARAAMSLCSGKSQASPTRGNNSSARASARTAVRVVDLVWREAWRLEQCPPSVREKDLVIGPPFSLLPVFPGALMASARVPFRIDAVKCERQAAAPNRRRTHKLQSGAGFSHRSAIPLRTAHCKASPT
jgi:hypothetical protein